MNGIKKRRRREKVISRIMVAATTILWLVVFVVMVKAAIDLNQWGQEFTPEPLTIETKDITELEKFREAVSEEVHNILNDDVVVTVYADGVKDFSYRGRVELANDGSDGTEVILFIYADRKTMLDEVF